MINFFSSWTKQVVFAVIISSIIEMILPDSKNKKYVKMIMGIYILFSIIAPVINKKDVFSLENLDIEKYASTDSEQKSKTLNQSSMDERLQELYVQELENNIKAKVEEYGYNVHSCEVEAVLTGDEEKQGINKINLNVSKKEEEKKSQENTNIKSVDKVEIKIGLDKYLNSNEEDDADQESEDDLKIELSQYYNVNPEKIHIKAYK